MPRWLKPCSVKKMKPVEAAWLAGFLDGEGSVCCTMGGHNHAYKTWILSIVNTDIRSLEKCVEITGVGKVNKKTKPKSDKHKQIYTWRVASQKNLKSVCEQVLPYCTIKQDQINLFLNEFKDLD